MEIMKTVHTAILPGIITYTGAELSPHWIAQRTGIFANSLVAFRGACSVLTQEMVDMEDRMAHSKILAAEMLHFLGEWFDCSLEMAVTRQRLFIASFAEVLRRHLPGDKASFFYRRGNDLFFSDQTGEYPSKLSVSIVTASAVSTLFHFGVNIDPQGAPIRAIGLKQLGVEPESLARETLNAWQNEWESIHKDRCKVVPR